MRKIRRISENSDKPPSLNRVTFDSSSEFLIIILLSISKNNNYALERRISSISVEYYDENSGTRYQNNTEYCIKYGGYTYSNSN